MAKMEKRNSLRLRSFKIMKKKLRKCLDIK